MERQTGIVVLAALFVCVSVALSHGFLLPDTGQTKCYQEIEPYAEIPCAGTVQDGAYTINPMNYTDNGDGTVTDNNTGLMWQQEDDGNRYNWYQASGTFHATYNPTSQDVCRSLILGGHSDWRLPTIKELITIADYDIPEPGPVIHPVFTNTKTFSYWSSTKSAREPATSAWVVHFRTGEAGINAMVIRSQPSRNYVRCVRAAQAPPQSLVDNQNGTVTDLATGLMWQQAYETPITWGTALDYCRGLSLGGHSDWRLPNTRELQWLVDETREDPAINTDFFSGMPRDITGAYHFVSSTSKVDNPGEVFVMASRGGNLDHTSKHLSLHTYERHYYYVRCVRAGRRQVVSVSVPTVSEWGMIIFAILAGIGSVYSLHRRTKARTTPLD